MSSSEVPEPWAAAMTSRGFVHGGRPSIRALTTAAKVGSSETVRQMIYGGRNPDPDTVEKVARALGVDSLMVSRWVGQARTVRAPFVPPKEAALLTSDEQKAISDLIVALAKGRKAQRPKLAVMPKMEDPEDYDRVAALHEEEPAGPHDGGTP